jgi:hypothetical protein
VTGFVAREEKFEIPYLMRDFFIAFTKMKKPKFNSMGTP